MNQHKRKRTGQTCSRVYDKENWFSVVRSRIRLVKHLVDITRTECRLQRVGCHPTELTLHKIWSVLHDRLQTNHALTGLPPWHEVQHVLTLRSLAIRNARGARQLNLNTVEHWTKCSLVFHFEQSSVKIELGSQGGNGQKTCATYKQQRSHLFSTCTKLEYGTHAHHAWHGVGMKKDRFVKKTRIYVRSFLQDEDIACISRKINAGKERRKTGGYEPPVPFVVVTCQDTSSSDPMNTRAIVNIC